MSGLIRLLFMHSAFPLFFMLLFIRCAPPSLSSSFSVSSSSFSSSSSLPSSGPFLLFIGPPEVPAAATETTRGNFPSSNCSVRVPAINSRMDLPLSCISSLLESPFRRPLPLCCCSCCCVSPLHEAGKSSPSSRLSKRVPSGFTPPPSNVLAIAFISQSGGSFSHAGIYLL